MNNNDLNKKINNLIIKKTNELNNFQKNLKIRKYISKYFKKINLSFKILGIFLAFLFYLKGGFLISLVFLISDIFILKFLVKAQNTYLTKNYPIPNINEQQLINQLEYLKEELERNNIKAQTTLNKENMNYSFEELKQTNNNNLLRQLTKK